MTHAVCNAVLSVLLCRSHMGDAGVIISVIFQYTFSKLPILPALLFIVQVCTPETICFPLRCDS